jgi:ubiquitin-conjugating enzyme E2 Q
VDLLVSFAYAAAAEKVLDEPLPTGMGLRVHVPEKASSSNVVEVGLDGLCDFDDLDIHQVRGFRDASIFEGQTQTSAQMQQAVAELIDSLPSVCYLLDDLKRFYINDLLPISDRGDEKTFGAEG